MELPSQENHLSWCLGRLEGRGDVMNLLSMDQRSNAGTTRMVKLNGSWSIKANGVIGILLSLTLITVSILVQLGNLCGSGRWKRPAMPMALDSHACQTTLYALGKATSLLSVLLELVRT
eukprot:8351433-Ditylum_brightwellii.AAC.1